jgi:hypothetical protein
LRALDRELEAVASPASKENPDMPDQIIDAVMARALHAVNVLPIVKQIQAAGAITPRAIATALNARGIRTARGRAWHDSTARNLMVRN